MKLLVFLSSALLLASCAAAPADQPAKTQPAPANSIYFWKTVFKPDSVELDFLARHNVRRLYLRMFDVVVDNNDVVPNATTRFETYYTKYPKANFIPVVYITLDALRAMNGREAELARLIVTRVSNMCSFNRLGGVSELQLDCDWTESTRESYFKLCDKTKTFIDNKGLGWDLSSTIRLHQLRESAPPVDRGVLMVYNTGNFNNPDARNSIIDPDDVKPYIKSLDSYTLPLDVAYPTYSWQLLYRDRQFAGLTRGLDTTDTTRFAHTNGPNSYRVLKTFPHGDRAIKRGDVVRTEYSDYATVKTVKDMIDSHLTRRRHSTILYHLDSSNLSKYTDNEISSLYD